MLDPDSLMKSPEVTSLCVALSLIESAKEAEAVLLDLCSLKEIQELAQRLEMARLLQAGESYITVSDKTGASSTTVSRVSKCLTGEQGGYRLLLDRMKSA